MKKMLGVLAILAGFGFVNAQAAMAEGVCGFVYKDATEAGVGFANGSASKRGVATATSYFGIVALGDCSVNAAAKNGKISNITYYDTHVKNICGFKKLTTRVYGN